MDLVGWSMRIAITGVTGRVGSGLVEHFAKDHEVVPLDRKALDLELVDELPKQLADVAFDVLINPAGMTLVDVCEEQSMRAWTVNAKAPGMLARICRERGARMIHFSTDYVFDGVTVGMKSEDEPADGLSIYGRSKRAGELAVMAEHPEAAIVRVSWVHGGNKPAFIDQICTKALRGEVMEAVADKWSMPTFMEELVVWIDRMLELPHFGGVWHCCQEGAPASWHDLAVCAVRLLHQQGRLTALPEVKPFCLNDLMRVGAFRALRPVHTAMRCERLVRDLEIHPTPWPEALAKYLDGWQSH